MNMQKTVIAMMIILLLIAGALGGVYWYTQKSSKEFDSIIDRSTKQKDLYDKQTGANSGLGTSQGMNEGQVNNPATDDDTQVAVDTSNQASISPDKEKTISNLSIDAAKIKAMNKSTYIVAFVGDQGADTNTTDVLKLIKNENADALALLGDYDYIDNPNLWYSMFTNVLGKDFPLIAVIGNHDEKEWKGYSQLISSHQKNTPSVKCTGETAIKSTCTFRDLHMYITAPGIDSIKETKENFANYITSSASSMKDLSATWNFCVWHKNQHLMQAGSKPDEAGWQTYEACRALGFPIVTGHEHSYSRTYLMDSFEKQIISPKNMVRLGSASDPAGVSGSSLVDEIHLEKGKSFVTVSGLGGKSIRPQTYTSPWWSTVYTSSQGAKYGSMFCAFNYEGKKDTALCYFKNVDNEVIDAYIVKK